MLSTKELQRYSRHLNLPQFGIETQEKLKKSKVLVVGTGGLGAPMLQYLTAVGVGTLGVIDFDVVDESNLQRQVLFTTDDVGQSKTKTAIERLRRQNPEIHFHEYSEKLDSSNALDIVKDYDIVADGTDNFPTRYLVNDACVLSGKPNVYASIFQFEGQVSVFNYQKADHTFGPNYRDLFPTPPPPGMVPSCAEGGVLGVLPGIVGSLQANEVIKVLTGIGEPLVGRLLLFDALDCSTRILNVKKDPTNPISGDNPTLKSLIDYESFCGLDQLEEVAALSVYELQKLKQKGKPFFLIDVREPYEYEAGNLGGILFPLGDIENHLPEIPRDQEVIIHCKSGGRSTKALKLLRDKYGYPNIKNLEGGALAWQKNIDPELTVV